MVRGSCGCSVNQSVVDECAVSRAVCYRKVPLVSEYSLLHSFLLSVRRTDGP
jgi:hypothetical protein